MALTLLDENEQLIVKTKNTIKYIYTKEFVYGLGKEVA